MEFLATMYRGGAATLVENTFDAIRGARPKGTHLMRPHAWGRPQGRRSGALPPQRRREGRCGGLAWGLAQGRAKKNGRPARTAAAAQLLRGTILLQPYNGS